MTGNNSGEIQGLPFAIGLDNKNITDYLHLFNPVATIYDGSTGEAENIELVPCTKDLMPGISDDDYTGMFIQNHLCPAKP